MIPLIASITLYQSVIPLKKPFIISLGRLDVAENVIVVIETNAGITGYGECSPFMTINGENIHSCFSIGKYIGEFLIGKNPLDIEGCSRNMDKLVYGNASIKSAFDIALYDIASQHAGLPLYRFLGGENNKPLFTDYTVSLSDKETMTTDALKIKENGFPYIKIKLGENIHADLERLHSIVNAVGQSIPLRIDANQGWNVKDAIYFLNEIKSLPVQFCEEPIPRWNFMALPEINSKSPVPLMCDESCCDDHDAKRLIALKACSMFNIKTGKSSGIFKALKIIGHAEKGGIKMQCGGFLESRLGFTAAAHLALSSNAIQYYDFDTPLMFATDPVIGGIIYTKNWQVILPEEPGLGAVIDPFFLKGMNKILIEK